MLTATLFAALLGLVQPDPVVLADFEPGNTADPRWFVVNDNVMGGRSTGGPTMNEGFVTFSGVINTNGGGFSSIRTQRVDHDLSAYDGITLRVRGDGRTYSVTLRTDERFRRDTFTYQAEFKPISTDEWQEIFLPFDDFRASWRGNDIADRVEPLNTAAIEQLGVIIGDGIDGPFSIEIDEIKATAKPDLDPDRTL